MTQKRIMVDHDDVVPGDFLVYRSGDQLKVQVVLAIERNASSTVITWLYVGANEQPRIGRYPYGIDRKIHVDPMRAR